jgi:outer membrane protein
MDDGHGIHSASTFPPEDHDSPAEQIFAPSRDEQISWLNWQWSAVPMPRLFFTVVFLLFTARYSLAQATAADSVEVLTLDNAIVEALQNNRLIKISNQSVLYANDEILAARTQRWPHFDVQLIASGLLTAVDINVPKEAFGKVNGTPVPATNTVIGTDPKFSALSLVQAYQPLTQLYNAHLNIELLKVGKKLSQEELRQQRQQITNSVKETYYSLLQIQSALEAAEYNVKALREVDRTTEQYVQEKAALPYQGAGVKVQLAQGELQVATLQDTQETEKENLSNLMGRDIRTDFRLSSTPDALPQEQDLELARQNALANRTEIRQSQFKIDQVVFAKRLQKAQYIPEVGIQYLFFSPFSIQGFPNYVNTLGISLKWDLYDWGNKRHLVDEKERTVEQGRLNLMETRNQVLIDLDNRFRKLREARAGLKVAQLGQEAEKLKLQVVLEQLLDAGIVRLRPVLITVGATILALFPLAVHGGPLWQPLCYAQIGGLGVATFITLLLVPVVYSIFVLDLKIVTWGKVEEHESVTLPLQPKGELS